MNYINYIFQIFRDYSRLQWRGPKLLYLLSIKKNKTKKKKTAIFNLYLDPCHKRPEQGVVHGFEIPVS